MNELPSHLQPFTDLIPSAASVKQETSKHPTYIDRMNNSIKKINKNIENAKIKGHTRVVFNCDSDYQSDLQKLFISKGYTIESTPISKHICW